MNPAIQNKMEIDDGMARDNEQMKKEWQQCFGSIDTHILQSPCSNCAVRYDLEIMPPILFVLTSKGKLVWWHEIHTK